jgi:hypothetical protein
MATEAERKIHDTLNAATEADARAPSPGVPPTPDPRWGVEHCCVREFWAVIERDGSLVRGRNVARTRRLAVGIYEVFFTGEVSNGVFVATIGRPGYATEPHGEITLALRFPGTPMPPAFLPFEVNKGVWIQTFDSNGKADDRSFHLLVLTH